MNPNLICSPFPQIECKVRQIFVNYIKRARAAANRTEAAKELKKMIAFNTLVVTELVADIKGESSDTSSEEPVKEEAKEVEEKQVEEDEEWESLQTLRKIRPGKELSAKLGKPGQTEITLKDDLPERERTDLYKTYLLFCLTGEVTKIPFGAQITTKKDDSEFVFLSQLGGILGLSSKETVEVHRSLAEQAFRQQAEVILADGQLTKTRVEQLDELQKQVGLPAQYAQKIIKSITTTKMAAAIETAVGQGRLTIKQIRELKEAGVELDNMISESLRENLFKKTVDDIFSSGTGEFNDEEVYEKIPTDLSINANKAKSVVIELARSRLSNSLIQAVALLRQRNQQGVVWIFWNFLFLLFIDWFWKGKSVIDLNVWTDRLKASFCCCRFPLLMICWLVTKLYHRSHCHGKCRRSWLTCMLYISRVSLHQRNCLVCNISWG